MGLEIDLGSLIGPAGGTGPSGGSGATGAAGNAGATGVAGAPGPQTVQTAGAESNSTPATPTATNSATVRMTGLAGAFTPAVTGTIIAMIRGDITVGVSTLGRGISLQLSYGTGTAPTSNGTKAGTQVGATIEYLNPVILTGSDVNQPFSVQSVITGLNVGTAIWLDLARAAVGSGPPSVNIKNVTISAIEF